MLPFLAASPGLGDVRAPAIWLGLVSQPSRTPIITKNSKTKRKTDGSTTRQSSSLGPRSSPLRSAGGQLRKTTRSELKKSHFHLGSWNAQSLLGPRLASGVEYLKNSTCHVVNLQETRFFSMASIDQPEFQLLFSPKTNSKDLGLGFFVKKCQDLEVINVSWIGVGIASLELEFRKVKIMVLNVYAPVCKSRSENDAKRFFERLRAEYIQLRKSFKGPIVLGGDFNAATSCSTNDELAPWICGNVFGNSNNHGDFFFNFLASTRLFQLNSRFRKRLASRWTFAGKKGVGRTEIDFFISNRIDLVEDVSTFPNLHNLSDHRLIRSRWVISVKSERDHAFKSRRPPSTGKERDWTLYEDAIKDLRKHATLGSYDSFVKTLRQLRD